MLDRYDGPNECIPAQKSIGGRLLQPTTRQKLQQKKDYLEAELKLVDSALAALDKIPDIEEVMNAVNKAL